MNSYVLDASVAAKWFLPSNGETLIEQSLSVFKDFTNGGTTLIVPDLFWPEIGNVIWKAVRVGRMSAESAKRSIILLTVHRLPTSPSAPLLQDAFSIAMNFERAVYDCIYVALALATKRPLLTADERLVNALGSRFPVRWLGSIA